MDPNSYALTVLGIVALTAMGVAIRLRVRRSGDNCRIDGETKPIGTIHPIPSHGETGGEDSGQHRDSVLFTVPLQSRPNR